MGDTHSIITATCCGMDRHWRAIRFQSWRGWRETDELYRQHHQRCSTVAGYWLCLLWLVENIPSKLVLFDWLHSGEIRIAVTLSTDQLSLSLAALVSLIAFLTIRFSINYMHRESGFQRFFMILSLFNSAMLLIILGGNAAMTFVGWELAGVSSYLLIAYAWDRPIATKMPHAPLSPTASVTPVLY